jgi:hypothetical protein
VTALEIEPAILEASRAFDQVNNRPLSDPRLRVVIDDARSALLRERQSYDVIISEPSNPWLTGSSNLFTLEFLQTGRNRLRHQGVFAQWFHLYGLHSDLIKTFLRTFHSVFPHVLVFQISVGDLLLLGSDAPLSMDLPRIAERLQQPQVRADLARVQVESLEDLLMRFRFGERELAAWAGSGPLNSDDRPILEFEAPKSLNEDTLLANAEEVLAAYSGLTRYLSPRTATDQALISSVSLQALRRGEQSAARMFARELRGEDDSAAAGWLLGELAWREERFRDAAQHWLHGAAGDPQCSACVFSGALLLQQQGQFAEANLLLAGTHNEPWALLLRGINRFYLGDRAGSLSDFQQARDAGLPGPPHIRAILEERVPSLRLIADFYAAEIGARNGIPAGSAESAFRQTLVEWRAQLLAKPPLQAWEEVVRGLEFHAQRAGTAAAERSLIARVNADVLEPLKEYNYGIRRALLGDLAGASQHFREATRRIDDPEGRARLQHSIQIVTRSTSLE